MTNYWQKRTYGELSREVDSLAKAGNAFLLSEYIAVGQGLTVYLVFNTNGVTARIHFFELSSTNAAVKASLIEAPTFTPVASAIVGRNLNRNGSDTHTATFASTSSISGGTKIASEYVGTAAKAGGQLSVSRVHTLKNATSYVMVFQNIGNQNTEMHINMGWSENVPGPVAFWPQP